MAGRGRGRGRGGRGFGGGFTFARQVEFVLFPEDVDLPKVKIDEIDPNMKKLLRWGDKFQNYWKASSYFLEETTSKGDESQSMHIARYSDKKKTMFTRDSLSQILVFDGFAKELVQGKSGPMRSQKKFRWNPESDQKRIDFLEQQEKKGQGRGDKGEEEKKDEEDEDEIGEDGEASDEDEIGDEDYIKGEYYDDNEDDYNDVDAGDDEGTY